MLSLLRRTCQFTVVIDVFHSSEMRLKYTGLKYTLLLSLSRLYIAAITFSSFTKLIFNVKICVYALIFVETWFLMGSFCDCIFCRSESTNELMNCFLTPSEGEGGEIFSTKSSVQSHISGVLPGL